jgi:hypothetical protein
MEECVQCENFSFGAVNGGLCVQCDKIYVGAVNGGVCTV